jgi:hypothetical protein
MCKSSASEELMKLTAVTVVTATVLAFAFPQTPPVLAQEGEIGAASRPFPLNDRSSAGTDSRGQLLGEQSKGTERSDAVGSERRQTNAGETAVRERSQNHIGLSHHPAHRIAAYKRGRRFFAISHHRHGLVTH